MEELCDNLIHVEKRQDFINQEQMKRECKDEGLVISAGENGYQFRNLISWEDFVQDKELMEKYSGK